MGLVDPSTHTGNAAQRSHRDRVTTADELARGPGLVDRSRRRGDPAAWLLDEPGVHMLAGRSAVDPGAPLAAGAIVSVTGEVAGLGNIFARDGDEAPGPRARRIHARGCGREVAEAA